MTREEAIKILADLTDNFFLHTWEEQYKALHMAVEALKAEPTGDLISRADALKPFCTAPDGTRIPEVDCDNFPVEFSVEFIKKHLLSLPSAKAEWIPCSERLPNESGKYLVRPSDGVLEDYSDFSEVMIMPYDADCEAFGWWIDQYDPISLGFVDSDFNEFEVLAWMPLPKPYREDGE